MAQTMAAAPGWSGHAVMRGLSGHTDVGTQFMLGSMIPETYAFIKGTWKAGYERKTDKAWKP